MSILPRLISAFRSVGYEPLTGYNPHHFANWMDAPFTRFAFQGQLIGNVGLALQEIMFLEHFADFITPRSILVTGNALGWSTVALALIFPNSRIVSLDPDECGNSLTNQVASLHGLNLTAVTGRSPTDVAAQFTDDFGKSLDLCLIDATHDDENLLADFQAIYPFLSPGGIVVMHDVINCNMLAGFSKIVAHLGMAGRLLTRTPSGIGIAWREQISQPLLDYIEVFTEPTAAYGWYQQLIRHYIGTISESDLTVCRAVSDQAIASYLQRGCLAPP